jgi:hypothetical protein
VNPGILLPIPIRFKQRNKDKLIVLTNLTMITKMRSFTILALCFSISIGLFTSFKKQNSLPEKWRLGWQSPAVAFRPLQMVHGADIRKEASYFKDTCGLGGVVCNVPFGKNYLKSEAEWTIFVDGVKAMQEKGLRVWIYDEDGYPSLGAGGRVLEADPSLQSLEMVYDKDNSEHPFTMRPCYEFTHSCNNFYTARKYPNPLDPKSTQKFIELTHQAYFKHLGPDLYGQVEAFFTDEPSMMAVNLGQLKEEVRKNVKVIDPLDPNKKNLPMVSWANDLPEKYKTKYGEDLMTSLPSLFYGNEEKDKVIRQKFWSLLAEIDRDNYYKAIQSWLKSTREANKGRGPVSSGHGLREESPSGHVPLDGNKLLVTSGFDIPGLDELSSDPTIWKDDAWMAAFFPGSSAFLNGQRRVMCEMSDFDQTINGHQLADLQHMQAATAWQMAFGVTNFNLYYTITYGKQHPNRCEPQYKEYCDFVGRVNSLLMDARPVRKTLFYYPVYDLQREYIPTAEKVSWRTQNERVGTLEESFRQLGGNLLKAQTQFVLVDNLSLEKAIVTAGKTIRLGQNEYTSLVFPKGITLPVNLKKMVEQAKYDGINVVFADEFAQTPSPEELIKLTGNQAALIPGNTSIAYGEFARQNYRIFAMVNTGNNPYSGELKVQNGEYFVELDPQTGTVSDDKKLQNRSVPVSLAPLQTLLFVVK